MNTIKELILDDGTVVLIEMEEVSIPNSSIQARSEDLPPGATPTTAVDTAVDTFKMLKGTLIGVFNFVHNSLKDNAPDEWGVELSIGFKGTTNPIPVIVSGEANAAIKVNAKWVKPKPKG